MRARTLCKAGLLPALLFVLCACGANPEPYSRIHDARLGADGGSIALLIERGDSELSGSTFSATWQYRPRELAVWRLTRANGALVLDKTLPLPEGYDSGRNPPRLDDWAVANLSDQPLPRCTSAFDACAIARAPQPFLSRDIKAGIDIGLQLIDGASGVRVHVLNGKPSSESWALRDRAALAAAAQAAMRESVRKLVAVAETQLAQSIAASGEYPRARGPTTIDSAISAGHASLRAEYYIDIGGVIVARVAEGDGPTTRLRWTPSTTRNADGLPASYACETDSAVAVSWWPDCKLMVTPETLDPELLYIMSRSAELKQSAALDAPFQSAKRGVTFAVRRNDVAAGQVWLGCVGSPASRVGGCDREQGDTVCTATLPLLCTKPAERGADVLLVAATARVGGDSLANIAAADARCALDFGAGWRLARADELGENFTGAGSIDAASRLWVDNADTPAVNCWSR